MARYVLGLLLLASSLTVLCAIPTDRPAGEAASEAPPTSSVAITQSPATSESASQPSPAAEPATQPPTASEAATQPPTTSESTTITEEPTTEEEETEPPAIVCNDPREIYDECGNSCGDRTCENLRRADVKCSKQCVEGCYCRNGYVRDKLGRCIPAYRCGKGWW
ncbi:threonine-rich protein-like isoform X1 [Anopheles stephensi]|uniref:TIL domain-containing protein n=1 Tax=Anopheles stephensi TaxID=30069 RepID=A0A182Y877_ANOST|nr:threonine-rich protein-like isoform X1 [Anopheles stephensi]